MAINQPHDGGMQMLKTMFGTQAKESTFTVLFYTGTALPVFADTDDAATPSTPVNLEDYPSCLNDITAVTFAIATLQPKITLVNQVPQIEFPEIVANFATALTGAVAGHSVYGYCVMADTAVNVIFRELFDAPFVPAASAVLRFIPTLRLGNTTERLT